MNMKRANRAAAADRPGLLAQFSNGSLNLGVNSMKLMKSAALACVMMMALPVAAPAFAQESNYDLGNVWSASRINVLPGQFENYMDHLAGQWKKVNEFAKAEGMLVEYHVLSTNNARDGEPDLILVIEYKDYYSKAQQEAFNKKVNALLATDDRSQTAASGARSSMRELMGSTEYQELVLK